MLTELKTYIGHRKRVKKLTFRALRKSDRWQIYVFNSTKTKLPAILLLHHSFFRNLPPLLVVRGIEYNRAVSTMVSLRNLRNHECSNNRFNEQR